MTYYLNERVHCIGRRGKCRVGVMEAWWTADHRRVEGACPRHVGQVGFVPDDCVLNIERVNPSYRFGWRRADHWPLWRRVAAFVSRIWFVPFLLVVLVARVLAWLLMAVCYPVNENTRGETLRERFSDHMDGWEDSFRL